MITETLHKLSDETLNFTLYKEKYAVLDTASLNRKDYEIFIVNLENRLRIFDAGSTLAKCSQICDFDSTKFDITLEDYKIKKEKDILYIDCKYEDFMLSLFRLIDGLDIINKCN